MRAILHLDNIEQVNATLEFVKQLGVQLEMEADEPTRKRRRKRTNGARHHSSNPAALVTLTDTRPVTRVKELQDIWEKARNVYAGRSVSRFDLARFIADERGEPDTRATSSVVTKWLNQGAIELVEE